MPMDLQRKFLQCVELVRTIASRFWKCQLIINTRFIPPSYAGAASTGAGSFVVR
jgi:hypothetical protein